MKVKLLLAVVSTTARFLYNLTSLMLGRSDTCEIQEHARGLQKAAERKRKE